jgi:hypothetical protein
MRIRTTVALVTIALVWVGTTPAGALDERAAWGEIPSPNNGRLANELAGLAIAGPEDVWAVGRYNSGRPPTATGRDTLAMHWDGAAFTIVPTPNPTWAGADLFTLEDAVAVAANDVWAVGSAQDFASLKSTTLVERWDGSEWTIVPSPNPAGRSLPNVLNAVDAASPTRIWAVGGAGFPEKGLILRSNGSRWKAVRNPCGVALLGVDVISESDIWAVGSGTTCHFDGSTWEVIPSPQPRPEFNEIAYILKDVSGTGPDDVWAVGHRVIESGEHLDFLSLVEHWNGSQWTLVTRFVPGHTLDGVVALAPDDVWAVGTDAIRGVVAHWNGNDWSLVPSPSPDNSGALADVKAESADHLWAVGTSLGRTVVLEAPSRFEGTVVGDTNVAYATVSWFGPESGSTETDPFGEYSAPGLTAGTYQLIATNPGCSPGSAEVVVTAGETVEQNLFIDC